MLISRKAWHEQVRSTSLSAVHFCIQALEAGYLMDSASAGLFLALLCTQRQEERHEDQMQLLDLQVQVTTVGGYKGDVSKSNYATQISS